MTVLAIALSISPPASASDRADGEGISLEVSPLHRSSKAWQPRHRRNAGPCHLTSFVTTISACPLYESGGVESIDVSQSEDMLHRTESQGQPQANEEDIFSHMGPPHRSTPCGDKTAYVNSEAGKNAKLPWRPQFVERDDSRSTVASISECQVDSSVSMSNVFSSSEGGLLKRVRRVCVNYLDEPGRIDIIHVECFDYSKIGEDWVEKAYRRRCYEEKLSAKQKLRRRGLAQPDKVSAEGYRFFPRQCIDHQLAMDMKLLRLPVERSRARFKDQMHQQRHFSAKFAASLASM